MTAADLKGVIDDPEAPRQVRLSVMSVEILNLFKRQSENDKTILIPYDWADFPFGTMGCAISAPVLTVTWNEESIGFIKPILSAFYGVPVNEFIEHGEDVYRFDDPDAKE